ncbi:uncharacterized protein LOC135488891 [Lineus longissimus]|uniref:uncharacterized protein LOC135488891 n=1 Tax=Lineus longissimus TaxID=88925 RepID=UPI00315DC2F7
MRGDVDTVTSHRHQPSNGEHSFIRILRLWLTINTSEGSAPQQLGYENLIPQTRTTEEDEEVGNEFPSHVMACPSGMLMMGRMYGMRGGLGMLMKVQRYQTMMQVIDVFNKKVQAEPLPGGIISIESVDIKKSESFESVTPDLESCYWYQRNHTSKHFLSSIRVYYIIGKTCTQQIDVTSFPPANLSKRGSSYQSGGTKYEKFGSLLERTSRWINSQNSVQLLNLQSPLIRYSSNDSTGLMPDSVDTETTNTIEFPTSQTNYLRIIRVFSLQSQEQSVRDIVTSKVFFPVNVAKRYETVQEVLQKAIQWIGAAGMQNRIVGAETFEMPVSSLGSPPNVGATKVKLQRTRGNHWITCFRLYFEGQYIEPDVPKQPNQKKSSMCCVL